MNDRPRTCARASAPLLAVLAAAALHVPCALRAEVLEVPTAEYATIQRAIDFAREGDTVLVKPGEYLIAEALTFSADTSRNLVVRSESGPDLTTIRLTETVPGDKSSGVVIFEGGQTQATVLEGFTITGTEAVFGSGVAVRRDAAPRVVDCAIVGNAVFGVTCDDASAPTFERCRIADSGLSGVVCFGDSKPSFVECTVTGTAGFGGSAGVSIRDQSRPRLFRCVIRENTVRGDLRSRGAGIDCSNASAPLIDSCEISGNVGHGVYASDASRLELVNCTLFANLGRGGFPAGGAVTAVGPVTLRIAGCTIAENAVAAGVILESSASLRMVDSIVWSNANGANQGPALQGEAIVAGQDTKVDVTYSCLDGEEQWEGEGNISDDPLFVSTGRIDFARFTDDGLPDFIVEPPDLRLLDRSPAIDAGTIDGAPEIDKDGRFRPCGKNVDMGAFEHCKGEQTRFTRGNANLDAGFNVSDGIFLLNYLFLAGAEPRCRDAADADDSGTLEISDAVRMFGFLFQGGAPPPPPGPGACGFDPTKDDLSCAEFAACD